MHQQGSRTYSLRAPECTHSQVALYLNTHSSHDQVGILQMYKFLEDFSGNKHSYLSSQMASTIRK